jgi:hypothetical protein
MSGRVSARSDEESATRAKNRGVFILVCESAVADGVAVGVADGFDFGDVGALSILGLQQFGCPLGAVRFRNVTHEAGIQQVDAGIGGEHFDLVLAWLVLEPGPRGEEEEGQDGDDDDVVLPASALEVPEDETFDAAHCVSF